MKKKTSINKKPKTVWVGNTPVTPFSTAELKRIDKRIKKRQERMRKRYPEVHGRKVDWISHGDEDGYLYFNVRFTDGKHFSIMCSPVSPIMVTDVVDFSDMKTGDDVIIREYYRRRKN